MKSRLITLFALVSIVLGCSGLLHADVTTTQITNNAYDDSFPRMQGDYLVWQAYVDDDWEIFLYNITSGTTTRITDNDYDDLAPQTDGNYVVWQGFNDGEWDIFLWHGSEETLVISGRSAQDVFPQIASGMVVWASDPFGSDFKGPGEIMAYDMQSPSPTAALLYENDPSVDPGNTLHDSAPKINDEVVLWEQTDDQGNTTLCMYDRSTGAITRDADYPWQDNPQGTESLRVLTRHDGHDREIFLHNRDSGTYHQITDNTIHDRYPCTSGNHVAWMAGGEIFLAQVKHLALVSPQNDAVLPVTEIATFIWEHIGYSEFKLEFSGDSAFPATDTLTLPEGNWLSESPFTPTEKEWGSVRQKAGTEGRVYWRVKAKDSNENVAFSETWAFTFGEDPSDGDGSTCFIDTASASGGALPFGYLSQ